jgi:hypothetical protein
VTQLSCDREVAFVVSDAGQVFSWGYDPDFAGVLGHDRRFVMDSPELIPTLGEIKSVSV